MRVVATLHGISVAASVPGYAAVFFQHLRSAGVVFRPAELFWRGAWFGPFEYWSLRWRWGLASATAGLDALLLTEYPEHVTLVTHSAGCRIAYAWHQQRVARGQPPISHWVSSGANADILRAAPVPVSFPGVRPAGFPAWTHCYRAEDPLGGPCEGLGARDVMLPPKRVLFEDHRDYWLDPAFADAVKLATQ